MTIPGHPLLAKVSSASGVGIYRITRLYQPPFSSLLFPHHIYTMSTPKLSTAEIRALLAQAEEEERHVEAERAAAAERERELAAAEERKRRFEAAEAKRMVRIAVAWPKPKGAVAVKPEAGSAVRRMGEPIVVMSDEEAGLR